MKPSTRQFWQFFITLTIAASAAAIYQTEQQTQALLKIAFRYKWVLAICVFAVNLGLGLYLLLRAEKNGRLWEKLELSARGPFQKLAGLILLLIALPILWVIRFDTFTRPPILFSILLWSWLWLTLMQAAGLKLLARISWPLAFGLALLTGGILFQSYFFLQPVSDYPFSLGWSEASRFYYGSLPFSRSIYGTALPLSVWHGSRYLLLSLSHLFGRPSLWDARLWQAILWLAANGSTAFVLVRRLRWEGRVNQFLVGGWFFLFLLQGAVYYHLLVCVIIILAGVSPRHVARSLICVLLASFWAGMSRVNWFPVPAMLAIALYLFEEPFPGNKDLWKYIRLPAVWGIAGLLSAFAGQFFYIAISGNTDLREFGSSFTSALLWYRWWPSHTNSLGVIPGLVLISLPPLVLLWQILRGHWNSIHPLRWFGLAAMLVILLGGGLVVSTKIGGGGDLHNMDAYIVLFGLTAIYFISGRVAAESDLIPPMKLDLPFALNLLLVIPVIFSLARVIPPVRYNRAQAAADLKTLQAAVQSHSRDGEVLFIYERHLLTFGMIPGVPIVPEYEVISLTEMAISGNQPYLDKFNHDLQSHRFTAIVIHKQNLEIKAGDFAEEAEAWNQLVAYPLLCEYQPELSLQSSSIQVLIPREKTECP